VRGGCLSCRHGADDIEKSLVGSHLLQHTASRGQRTRRARVHGRGRAAGTSRAGLLSVALAALRPGRSRIGRSRGTGRGC
jgi:hypothetical protein